MASVGSDAGDEVEWSAHHLAAMGVEHQHLAQCVMTSSCPSSRNLVVVGIPMTGVRHRTHWVGG